MRAVRHPASLALAGVWLVTASGTARALPAVLTGDPIDGVGKTYSILPGVPLAHPGPDDKWSTGDDVVNPGLLGDVDLVLRTGGLYVPGSGVIPVGAGSVATAPSVTVGGSGLPTGGSEATYQLIVSDGAPVPAAGAPLPAADLDGRGAVILAYADLDGDGFVGATSADPAGTGDDALEEQEAFTPVGQRLGVVQSGLVSGTIAISSGLPASAGGLGVVVVGGAATGSASPLFLDGAWISTLLPCVWPADATRVVGKNPGAPGPSNLVDLEISLEDFYCPPSGDAVFGNSLAIPLDGTSVTTDILRSVSGPTTSVGLASPVNGGGFVVAPHRRLTPVVSSGGSRQVVEAPGVLTLGDDGPGGVQASVVAFPADALGNQSDVPPGGSEIQLSVTSNLRIVAPDVDADPLRETLSFPATGIATVVLDDAGAAGDGGTTGQLVASLDGAVAHALRVSLSPPLSSGPLGASSAIVRHSSTALQDRLTLKTLLDLDPALAPLGGRDVTITVSERGTVLFSRLLPAGALDTNSTGTTARYRDPTGVITGRIAALRLRRTGASTAHLLQVSLKALDLSAFAPDSNRLDVEVKIGPATFSDRLDCEKPGGGSRTSCTL